MFVENHPPCARTIAANLELVGALDEAELLRVSAEAALAALARREERFDILFADPPYERELGARTLAGFAKHQLWNAEAIVVIQTERGEALPETDGALTLARRADYGATSLWFYRPDDEFRQHA